VASIPGRADRPSVLLLVLDAVRADAVEPFGAPSGSSPTLAQLARRGHGVVGVRSTGSWTLPSHIAMFTGQLARSLGLGQAPGQMPQGAAPVVRAQRERLLAENLRQAGYATKGVTTNIWAGRASGFDSGFEEFEELDASRQGNLGTGLRLRLRWDLEGVRARGDDGAARAEAVMRRWLGEPDRRPFFWFVNLVECHSPYLPPRPYDGVSALTRLRAADEAQRYLTFESILLTGLGVRTVPEGALRRMRRLYAGAVRYVDAWVARLLESLSDAGRLEDTLVLVCSDHGENFGEGGLIAHGLSLDERLLRVPFIAAGPGASEFEGMRSLAELPKRIGRAIRLERHPWGDGLVGGLPVAQWDPFELTSERLSELSIQWQLDDAAARRLISPLTCAVSGHFKLVRGAGETDEALFDLEADPLEMSPVTGEEAMAERAGQALGSLRAAVNDPGVQATTEMTAAPDEASAEETAEIERKMRLLGYM
jgi:Sulfatase